MPLFAKLHSVLRLKQNLINSTDSVYIGLKERNSSCKCVKKTAYCHLQIGYYVTTAQLVAEIGSVSLVEIAYTTPQPTKHVIQDKTKTLLAKKIIIWETISLFKQWPQPLFRPILPFNLSRILAAKSAIQWFPNFFGCGTLCNT